MATTCVRRPKTKATRVAKWHGDRWHGGRSLTPCYTRPSTANPTAPFHEQRYVPRPADAPTRPPPPPPQRSCRITGPTKRKGIDFPKIRSSMSKTGCVEKSHPSARMRDGFCELLRQLITLDTELTRRHAALHNLDG